MTCDVTLILIAYSTVYMIFQDLCVFPPYFLPVFPPPIQRYFYPSKTGVTRSDDMWTDLYIIQVVMLYW